MICNEIRIKSDSYLDDMMNEEEKSVFEDHLSECGECRIYVKELKNMIAWLKEANDVQPPAELRASVLKILRKEQTKRSFWLRPGFVQAAAAAAVFVMLIAGNILPEYTPLQKSSPPNYSLATEADQNIPPSAPAALPEIAGKEATIRTNSSDLKDSSEHGATEDNSSAAADADIQQSRRLPYRLILNIVGILILLLLSWAGMKKRREALL